MRGILVPLAMLALLWAGCVELEDESDPTRKPGTDDEGECRAQGRFVKAQHHPGFSPPEYQYMFYTWDENDLLFYVRAHERSPSGTGHVNATGAAMTNVTLAEARDQLKVLGVWRADRDYQVSVAWLDTVHASDAAEFCDLVRDEFYDMKARYADDRIADCDGFTFNITTTQGSHQSYSYCQAGPQEVRHAFDEIVDASRERLGVQEEG